MKMRIAAVALVMCSVLAGARGADEIGAGAGGRVHLPDERRGG